jgi:hypothetical protein
MDKETLQYVLREAEEMRSQIIEAWRYLAGVN